MIVWQCVNAIAQGALFALTVPVLFMLLGSNPSAVWPWLWAFIMASALYAIVYWLSLRSALRSSSTLSLALHTRIGDHLSNLPLGWYTADRIGQLSTLLGQGVVDIMGIAAHLIRPLISGLLTPATIVRDARSLRLAAGAHHGDRDPLLAARISMGEPSVGESRHYSGSGSGRRGWQDHRVCVAAASAARLRNEGHKRPTR
jgi:hypothetical protein